MRTLRGTQNYVHRDPEELDIWLVWNSAGTNKKEDARMKKFRQYVATTLIVAMVGSTLSIPALADEVSEDTGGGKKRLVSGR